MRLILYRANHMERCSLQYRTGSLKAGSIPNQVGFANATKHRQGDFHGHTHIHTNIHTLAGPNTHTHTHTQTHTHRSYGVPFGCSKCVRSNILTDARLLTGSPAYSTSGSTSTLSLPLNQTHTHSCIELHKYIDRVFMSCSYSSVGDDWWRSEITGMAFTWII